MSNKELHHGNASRPETPSAEEIHALLVRLLELVAVRVAEKLRQRSSTEPGKTDRPDGP